MKTEDLCTDRHGIHESFDVDPHPKSACPGLIEMGRHPVTFMDVFLSDEFGEMARKLVNE